MGNKAKTTQTNTPGFATVPTTPQEAKLEGMVGSSDFSVPIRNAYSRAQAQSDRSWNNPLGAYTTADVRDKSMREQNLGSQQQLGAALGDAALQNNQNTFNQQATVAGLMQPHFYNAKTTNESKFALGDYLKLGLSAAQGAATGK